MSLVHNGPFRAHADIHAQTHTPSQAHLRDVVESGGWHRWHSKASAPIHDAGDFKLVHRKNVGVGGDNRGKTKQSFQKKPKNNIECDLCQPEHPQTTTAQKQLQEFQFHLSLNFPF